MSSKADVEEAAELFERVWVESDDLEVGGDPYDDSTPPKMSGDAGDRGAAGDGLVQLGDDGRRYAVG